MAEKKRIVVAGANGVFGSLLCGELEAHGGFEVVRVLRRPDRRYPDAVILDLSDIAAVGRAAQGAFAVACAAGPFQLLDRSVVRAVVEAGAHWLDIADDEDWFFDLFDDRRLRNLAEDRGAVVIPGLSTLPAISGALVRSLGAPPNVSITLFIGNDNPKGPAAIASGARLRTPDRELLWRELHCTADVQTEFEFPGVAYAMRLLSVFPLAARVKVARGISRVARWLRFGTKGGRVEVRSGAGSASVTGRDQRMAILPLVFALDHLPPPGVYSPSVLPQDEMLQWIESRS